MMHLSKNNGMAIMILVEEKSSVSLADRLDEVVIKAGYLLFCIFMQYQWFFFVMFLYDVTIIHFIKHVFQF